MSSPGTGGSGIETAAIIATVGSGGFEAVYKGIFSNGTILAVKILHGTSDKIIEKQFMAEVSTIGRVHHFNLVRLTAQGIAYLHQECQQRIIHHDIKPGNILLDAKFFPEVADFGLTKLCNRKNSHVTMPGVMKHRTHCS
ncbi:hypothetical protein CRYUN_Cryun11dG0048400 [Craigia yunnanensis]